MKSIITTTIYPPTEATIKYCDKTLSSDWNFIIIGDTKTPHELYEKLEKKYANVEYLSPKLQKDLYPRLSESIGWKCIQRRNIGYVHAYKLGAQLIASVDDDNIPYDTWGENLLVGKEINYDCHRAKCGFFDPLSVTENKHLWHRGFPIDLILEKNDVSYVGQKKKKVLVQANLWDGDPDIDAMARLIHKPIVKFDKTNKHFGSDQISPFNSQNTFIHREALPFYCVLTNVGRMDDIWGAYILQHYFPDSVIYDRATVYQDRNEQDLIKNLEDEVLGYRKTLKLLSDLSNYRNYIPDSTRKFLDVYRDLMSS